MCNKHPPFEGDNIAQLAMKVVRCEIAPTLEFYTSKLRKYLNLLTQSSLLGKLLSCKEHRRPAINEILREQLIRDRIKTFLSETQEVENAKKMKKSIQHLPQLKKREATPR